MFMSILNAISKLATLPIFKDFFLGIIHYFTKTAQKKAQIFAQKKTEEIVDKLPTVVDELAQLFQILQQSSDPAVAARELAIAIFDVNNPISQLLFSSKHAFECFNQLNQPQEVSPEVEMACYNKATL